MKSSPRKQQSPQYNGVHKEEFLSTLKDQTRPSYARVLGLIKPLEESLDKGIQDFTNKEMEDVLLSFNANNHNTLESYARIISAYLNWLVANKKATYNILKDYRPEDFDRYLLNEEEYFSERRLRYLEDNCKNAQDAVILRLLFIGVNGERFSEMRNLKKSDIDEENMRIKVTNNLKEENGYPTKFTQRYIPIDERTLTLLKRASKQLDYLKRNGMAKKSSRVAPYTDLVDNEYVIRASITQNKADIDSPVDKYVIYRRITTIRETLGTPLTSKFIQRSGMLYFAKSLVRDSNEITLDDIKIVADRFNLASYHNIRPLVTIENIKKVYNKE